MRIGLAEVAGGVGLEHDLKKIFHVINADKYARNMHVLELDTQSLVRFAPLAQTLIDLAKRNGIVPLVRGDDVETAHTAGAEGVLLENLEALSFARAVFGKEDIIGLFCGTSQERAAAAHDARVDFVSFGTGDGSRFPSPDLLRFWTILSDKPALIEGPITNDMAAFFVERGAMFLDAGPYIFTHPKGVMQGTVNMLHAIDEAARQPQSVH